MIDSGIADNSVLPTPNNALGIAVGLGPGNEPAFGGVQNLDFDHYDFGPRAQMFLEQMDDDRISAPETDPRVPGSSNAQTSGVLPHIQERPLAPLPSRALHTSPLTPRFSPTLRLLPGSRTGSPLLAQTLIAHHERESTGEHSPVRPSRPLARSVSAPLHTPLRRSSLQVDSPLRATTRPSTPVEPAHNDFAPHPSPPVLPSPRFLPGSPSPNPTPGMPAGSIMDEPQVSIGAQDAFDEPSLPFSDNTPGIDEELGVGTRRRRRDSDVHIPEEELAAADGFVIRESEAAPHIKRVRLLTPDDLAPTENELKANVVIEYGKIQAKRKCHQPKDDTSKPKKGAAMGSFSEEEQAYMTVGRTSITWDQIACSPWSETQKALVDRAIERADAATKMKGEQFVDSKFKETVSSAYLCH